MSKQSEELKLPLVIIPAPKQATEVSLGRLANPALWDFDKLLGQAWKEYYLARQAAKDKTTPK